jgi:hypothetical protein
MCLFFNIKNIEQHLIEKLENFLLTKKNYGTPQISGGTLKCRGTQFENHCPTLTRTTYYY